MAAKPSIVFDNLSRSKSEFGEGTKLTALVKLVSLFGLFELHDILHYVHPIFLLAVILGINSLIVVGSQRPNYSNVRKSMGLLLLLSVLEFISGLCWIYSLLESGPIRTVLLFQFPSAVRIITKTCQTSHRTSGLLFLFGNILLISVGHELTGCFLGMLSHIISLVRNRFYQKVEKDFGGRSRTQVITEVGSFITSLIVGIISYTFGFGRIESHVSDVPMSTASLVLPILLASILAKSIPWLAEFRKLKAYVHGNTSVYPYRYTLISAFVWGQLWDHPITSKVSGIFRETDVLRRDHEIDFITIIATVSFVLSDYAYRHQKSTSEKYSLTPKLGLWKTIVDVVSQKLLHDSYTRSVLVYCSLSIVFAFAELFLGVYNSSLSLVSDGLYMFIKCAPLGSELIRLVVTNLKPCKRFTFGYGGVETQFEFLNSFLLLVSGLMLIKESILRLSLPVVVTPDHTVTVALVGLIINIMGIAIFGEGQSGFAIQGQSLFKQIFLATFGLIGIIFSSFFIEKWSFYWFDPYISLTIAFMIVYSAIPLLKSSSEILMLKCPSSYERAFKEALQKTMQIRDVVSYRDQRCWSISPKITCCSIVLQISEDGNENQIINTAGQYLKEAGIIEITVQCEKEVCLSYLSSTQSDNKRCHLEWNPNCQLPFPSDEFI